MVLLNGADGMSDMFAKALTMGGTGLGPARQLLSTMNPASANLNGTVSPVNGAAPPAPRAETVLEKIPVVDEAKE